MPLFQSLQIGNDRLAVLCPVKVHWHVGSRMHGHRVGQEAVEPSFRPFLAIPARGFKRRRVVVILNRGHAAANHAEQGRAHIVDHMLAVVMAERTVRLEDISPQRYVQRFRIRRRSEHQQRRAGKNKRSHNSLSLVVGRS